MNDSRKHPLYLDFAASTPMTDVVRDAYIGHLSEVYGNASGRHAYGDKARSILSQSRSIVAESVGSSPTSVYFTASATESINLVLRGVFGRHADCHVVACATEHKAVLATLHVLSLRGLTYTLVEPRSDGCIHPEDVIAAIRPNTRLVCSMLVNNETGVINPVRPIAHGALAMNVPTLCDASQALGRVAISMRDLGCTALVLSSHKSYGPMGVSALCMAKVLGGGWLWPTITGGSHESGFRAGTENVPAIAAFAQATQHLSSNLISHMMHVGLQREAFEFTIRGRLPECHIVGSALDRASHISTAILPFVDGELMLSRTRSQLAISSGSACNSFMPEPSHVLTAMGYSAEVAQCAVRVSFGWQSTVEDATAAANILADNYEQVMRLMN